MDGKRKARMGDGGRRKKEGAGKVLKRKLESGRRGTAEGGGRLSEGPMGLAHSIT